MLFVYTRASLVKQPPLSLQSCLDHQKQWGKRWAHSGSTEDEFHIDPLSPNTALHSREKISMFTPLIKVMCYLILLPLHRFLMRPLPLDYLHSSDLSMMSAEGVLGWENEQWSVKQWPLEDVTASQEVLIFVLKFCIRLYNQKTRLESKTSLKIR